MSIEREIIEYLQQQSKGVINLQPSHARHIVEMVTGTRLEKTAIAKLHRKNDQLNSWDSLRNIRTTNEYIHEQIIKALENGPVMDFYMYELFNDAGEFEGRIFTIDQFIFER